MGPLVPRFPLLTGMQKQIMRISSLLVIGGSIPSEHLLLVQSFLNRELLSEPAFGCWFRFAGGGPLAWSQGQGDGIIPAQACLVPNIFHWSNDFSSRRPSMLCWLASLSCPHETRGFHSTLFIAAITVTVLPHLQVPGLSFREMLSRFGAAS